jgi:serine/threonine protein kinase
MAHENVLSDYKIISPLGRGAHSIVYHVLCEADGQEYALKVMEKSKIIKGNLMRRLQNEIQIQTSFDSPHIVKLYQTFEDEE